MIYFWAAVMYLVLTHKLNGLKAQSIDNELRINWLEGRVRKLERIYYG